MVELLALNPAVCFRRGKQLVGNVAILFSDPSQKWPKANPCCKSSEFRARGKQNTSHSSLDSKVDEQAKHLWTQDSMQNSTFTWMNRKAKLNVNVLLGLCMYSNSHQAVGVLAEYWCSIHVPRLWTANARRKTHMHTHHFKPVLCCQHIETANCTTWKDYYGDTKEGVEKAWLLPTSRKEASGRGTISF